MLPDMNSALAVANQIVQDRVRQAEQQRMLNRLPKQPRRRPRIYKRIAYSSGAAMVGLGKKLKRIGETSLEYEPVGNEAI